MNTLAESVMTHDMQEDRYYRLGDIIENYRDQDGSLIPVLHIAKGLYGELSQDLLGYIALKLNMPFSKVRGVAMFYESFAITQTCKVTQDTKEELYRNIGEIIEEYRGKDGALIPVLHIAEGIYGRFTPELLQIIADKLELPLSKVTGVATFYKSFNIFKKGRYTIRVCMGNSCYGNGANKLLKQIKEQLGIEVGETTKDGEYTLEVVRCTGECDQAPGISIDNGISYTRVKPDRLEAVLNSR